MHLRVAGGIIRSWMGHAHPLSGSVFQIWKIVRNSATVAANASPVRLVLKGAIRIEILAPLPQGHQAQNTQVGFLESESSSNWPDMSPPKLFEMF